MLQTYKCTADFTRVLQTLHVYCRLYTCTAYFTRVLQTLHVCCRLYMCVANFTRVLQTLQITEWKLSTVRNVMATCVTNAHGCQRLFSDECLFNLRQVQQTWDKYEVTGIPSHEGPLGWLRTDEFVLSG